MFDIRTLLVLIPVLPLLAAAVTGFFGPRFLRKNSHWPCIVAVASSCVLAFLVLGKVAHAEAPLIERYYTWMQTGSLDIGLTLRADGLTALMLITITFVGSWIAIFAVGYMSHEREHEAGYARFFAAVALFVFSMTLLVLGDNYLVMFAGWEGVGLCSYLLIGFWFQKPSAAAAARKAFLVTRLGDAGMMLGILLLWAGYQYAHPQTTASGINFETAFTWASSTLPDDTDTQLFFGTVALLLLCGAVGKSAQIPLYVWLPDAMEGPTPVSALIHAATMVTAGVYLVARSMPIFHAAPPAVLLTVASIGAATALLAALIALTQHDLKRVLAYSTISQIGYMFLALGCATTDGLVLLAVTAAIFHLFTHAFFKALLFLSAGSVMHAMGNVIDMRRFSGLRTVLPTTHWTFLCGAAALAGVPLLSGFWSKDEILGAALEASHHAYGNVYMVLFISGLVTAGLTAFYTFRAYFLTFWGEVKVPPEAGHHVHESPPVMTVPLMVLAVGAVGLGIVVQPFTHWFGHLLEHHWLNSSFGGTIQPAPHGFNIPLMAGSSLFALGGVGLAWLMYVRSPALPGKLAGTMQGLYQLSLNKFHVDELYYVFFVGPATLFAGICQAIDFLVDSVVDLVGQLPGLLGKLVRPIQNGLVQFYALAMILGLTVFLSALVLRMAK
ncbi:MAG: NADH-quinone oxidoreductase subunit L [Planctomycetia bacterium]|nr:NADH-quinone oxidoreductase subunit L [Planctomycetia bacterium]